MIARSTALLALAAFAFAPMSALADDASGKPNAAEAVFVSKVSSDLNARFATPGAALKAGYLRYTDEDGTGAISYANRQWSSADAAHPSQLWYDVKGRLIGADYSEPQAGGPPNLFGVQPARWQKFGLHVHYGLAGPNGTTTYGATGPKKLATVGGSAENPSAADLVKLGLAKTPGDVRFVFTFPAVYDLALWVIPNSDGAFADKNPSVKPQHALTDMGM